MWYLSGVQTNHNIAIKAARRDLVTAKFFFVAWVQVCHCASGSLIKLTQQSSQTYILFTARTVITSQARSLIYISSDPSTFRRTRDTF
jgi:hypothetical protein